MAVSLNDSFREHFKGATLKIQRITREQSPSTSVCYLDYLCALLTWLDWPCLLLAHVNICVL